jgi:hypothetical protein
VQSPELEKPPEPILPLLMKKLTAEQFREYAADPLATGQRVRKWCSVPEDKYYTVAMPVM